MREELERLSAALVSQLRSRLELAGVEWQEEKLRLARVLLSLMLGLFFLQLAIVLAVIAVVVAWWDGPRVAILGAAAGLCLVAAGMGYRVYRRSAAASARPFEATLAELHDDEQALRKLT